MRNAHGLKLPAGRLCGMCQEGRVAGHNIVLSLPGLGCGGLCKSFNPVYRPSHSETTQNKNTAILLTCQPAAGHQGGWGRGGLLR